MDVFFYEAFEEEAWEIRKHLLPGVTAGYTWKTIQEHGVQDPPAPLISIRTQSTIPTSWSAGLKGVLTRSTGYDHIITFLQKCDKAPLCGHLPPYCSRAVAEQAMMLWMALLRSLKKQTDNFSHFCRDGLTGLECEHKTLLVVGVGNIGFEIVRIGEGLGMKVLGVDIVEKHPSVSYTTIEEGFPLADIVICAMNLTAKNKGYFHYRRLKKIKPGGIFVNISRGELSPSGDLIRLLAERHLGGIALDVFNHEQELARVLREGFGSKDPEVRATLELAKQSNVILTPHNAFNTREALASKASFSAQQIDHFIRHGEFRWIVAWP